ncbi:transcriptional regulator [Streptomyces sp. NPDC048172]|uniref:transcriptional regulator n=1 Tax=Streptomyces sp. NPDC048172 TaxID=3365505 RepID=UPI0037203497
MPAAVAPSRRPRPPGEPAAVSPLLRRLAAERATGAFTRAWGTLFLLDGQIAHAESPAAPGLDVLLTTGGSLPDEVWHAAVAEAGPYGSVARHLVETGRVPGGVLELCQLGALYDAAFFVLAPGGGPGRFRHGVRHWLGAFRAVPAEAVERETVRRRSLLDRVWPDAGTDTLPVTRTACPPGVRVPARRRPVLELADGGRTACEIARALGRPAFHTLIDLRKLAASGLVAPAAAPALAPAPVPIPVPEQAQPLPSPEVPRAPLEDGPPPVFDDPDVALLRRLRDALEAL